MHLFAYAVCALSCYLFFLLIYLWIYLYLPTYLPTYIYLHLPTSTYIYLHLPTSTYIYRHLPTSTYIYLHLPTSTYIYLHLPTSTYIYLHLPTAESAKDSYPGLAAGIVNIELHVYGIPGVSSERWNLFAWAALNGDAPLEVLVVTMDCPTKTCPSQLSVQIISAPVCGSTNLSPSKQRSIAQLSIRSFCSCSICSSFSGWSFGSVQLASVSCRDCRKKQLGASPENPKPGW